MSTVTIAGQAEHAGQYCLRWSDNPDLPVREEPVEIVGSDFSEPILRSAFPISQETKVFLIGKNYLESGIIRSCRKEGDSFLLTIHINPEYAATELLPKYDPGLFAVDEFLTEEEEAKILESLKGGSSILRESGD